MVAESSARILTPQSESDSPGDVLPGIAVSDPDPMMLATGTDGARIITFPQAKPVSAHVSKTAENAEQNAEQNAYLRPMENSVFAHVSKTPEPPSFSTLWGSGQKLVWRAKKIVRDATYPGISASGHYFRKDSGGFSLFRRSDRKYVSFYTKQAIKTLEGKYASKKTSKRK